MNILIIRVSAIGDVFLATQFAEYKITNHQKDRFFARNNELTSLTVMSEYWDKSIRRSH